MENDTVASFVGVDGCRSGWFAVEIEMDGTLNYAMFADIQSLWEHYADAQIILIDMPIGLSEIGQRRCDIEARRVLGARRSSIFPVPTRAALYAETYQQASNVNRQITGLKLSKQTWNIIPKIRELDELLRNDADARLKMAEIHPEVLFWGLAGAPMIESKKTDSGYEERLRILQEIVPDAGAMIDSAMHTYPRADVARDDIVDALVIAVTARIGDFCSFPPYPDRDGHGLPMQILYARGPNIAYQPRVLGFHHLHVTVPGGEEMAARGFYASVLGLLEAEPPDVLRHAGGVWMHVGEMLLHIDSNGVNNRMPRPTTQLVLTVDNLTHWVERLHEFGLEIVDVATHTEYQTLTFCDPYENQITFVQLIA